MLGHDHITGDDETILLPYLLQDFQKDVAPTHGFQPGVTAIATAGNKVKISAALDPSQPFGHREILFIPPFAPQQKLRKEWGTLISGEPLCNGEAWATRTRAAFGPVMVDVIGREAFIKNKRATGRARDLGDIEALGE